MMIKRIYTLLLLMPILLVGCEEDVVLDLREIEKRLVVEATLTNLDAVRVSLSYSQNFYDTPELKRITDATVFILSGDGFTEQLYPNSEGLFLTRNLVAVSGVSYALTIEIEEQKVEVTVPLPPPVEISSVVFVPNPFRGSADTLNVFVNVQDRVGEDNDFRLLVNKFGAEPSNELYLVDDSFGKDGLITMPVYYKNFTWGDTVIVELQHHTREMYDYFNGLSDNLGDSFNSIAPGNPISNMPDDVFGYFAAYGVVRDTIIVTPFSF